ncbi:CheY-like chemotaxis protein, partial [Bradyrhizobium sp. S3.9.1]
VRCFAMGLHPLKARPSGQLLKANLSPLEGPLHLGGQYCRPNDMPLATAVQPAEPDLAAHPLGAGEVVMLVATDSDRLLGDEERLAALGYEAVGYMTAEAAREAVEVSPGRFDFVILGQLGSLTKSLELATDLHRSLPSIPIVLATRGSSEIGAETLVAAGIADVVRWPIVVEEIATALSQFSKKGE